jgi:hypothetical protein
MAGVVFSVSDLRYRDTGSTWLGRCAVRGNPDWEIEIDGDEAGPEAALWTVAAETLPSADDLVALGVRQLQQVTRFGGAAEWYPEGARYTFGGDDGRREPQVVLYFSIEDDFYGLWSVTLVRRDGLWYPMSLTRSQT